VRLRSRDVAMLRTSTRMVLVVACLDSAQWRLIDGLTAFRAEGADVVAKRPYCCKPLLQRHEGRL